MLNKFLSLKYVLAFLIFAVLTGVGIYALNRPWGGYSIEFLAPVNRNSAVLIRRSDFPWQRFWLMKEDVRGGVLWYQKIPLPDLGKNTLILGPDTITVHFMDGKWREYAYQKRGSGEEYFALKKGTKTLSRTYDLKSGQVLWSHKPDANMGFYGFVKSSLISINVFYDFLYNFRSMKPEIRAVQPRSGKLLWKIELAHDSNVYPTLRGNILHLHQVKYNYPKSEKVTHSFYNESGKLLHTHSSEYDQSCYGGGAFWYLSTRGDLRKIEVKPFRDRVFVKGMNSSKKLFLQACGKHKDKLILLFYKKAGVDQFYDLQLTEISPRSGKRFRTQILKSRGPPTDYYLYSMPDAEKFLMNGPYGRYVLLGQEQTEGFRNTPRKFLLFDLNAFRMVYDLKARGDTFEDWSNVIPGERSLIIRLLDFPFFAGLWNAESGGLDKGVYLSSFGVPPDTGGKIKDGVLWLFGGPHWAVLDGKSLQVLHSSGPAPGITDETALIRNILGFKE